MTMTCSELLIEVARDMEAGREVKLYRIQLAASLVQNLEAERDRLNRALDEIVANAQTNAEQAEADASARRQMAAIMADCRPENVVVQGPWKGGVG